MLILVKTGESMVRMKLRIVIGMIVLLLTAPALANPGGHSGRMVEMSSQIQAAVSWRWCTINRSSSIHIRSTKVNRKLAQYTVLLSLYNMQIMTVEDSQYGISITVANYLLEKEANILKIVLEQYLIQHQEMIGLSIGQL